MLVGTQYTTNSYGNAAVSGAEIYEVVLSFSFLSKGSVKSVISGTVRCEYEFSAKNQKCCYYSCLKKSTCVSKILPYKLHWYFWGKLD